MKPSPVVVLVLTLSILLGSGFVAVSAQERSFPKVKSGQMFRLSGFRVKAPRESGWVLLGRADSSVAFGRFGARQGESYAASVKLALLPGIPSKAELAAVILESVGGNTEPKRYSHLTRSIKANADSTDFRVHVVYEDRGPEGVASGTAAMTVDAYGRYLRGSPNTLLVYNFSHRYYAGGADRKLESRAQDFLADNK